MKQCLSSDDRGVRAQFAQVISNVIIFCHYNDLLKVIHLVYLVMVVNTLVIWNIAILGFIVCLPRILQGSRISKIMWHALSLVFPDFLMSFQP